MKRKIIFVLVAGLGLLFVYIFFGYSFFEISVPQEGAILEIVDQRSSSSKRHNISGKTKKLLLKRGTYEVLVSREGKAYFEIVKLGGYLQTTNREAKLESEYDRQFIGENPLPCMYVVEDKLWSSLCGGSLSSLQAHKPATSSQASLIKRQPVNRAGDIEGFFTHTTGSYLALKAPELNHDTQAPHHALYRVKFDGSLELINTLTELSGSATYKLMPRENGDGFLAYSTDSGRAFSYPSFSGRAESIDIGDTSRKSSLYQATIRGDTMAFVFTTTPLTEEFGVETGGVGAHADIYEESITKQNEDARSDVTIIRDGGSRHFAFDAPANKIRLCEEDRLCVTNNFTMDVYDISSTKQRRLYSVRNVVRIENVGNNFYVVKNNGVYLFDVSARQARLVYSFGDFGYCGISVYQASLSLCVSRDDERWSLLLTPADKHDGIDKKILRLLGLSEVESLSVYKQFITITPTLGKRNSSQVIQDKAIEFGIDTSKYKLINPLQQLIESGGPLGG